MLAALIACLASLAVAAMPQHAHATSSGTHASYKIVYHLNGGTQATGQVRKVEKGSKLYVSSLKKPKKKGYEFKGWYKNASLTKKVTYVKGDPKSSKRTLYAKWKPKKYSITYKLRGGTFSGSYAKTYTYGKGRTLPTPTRNGYEFAGWYKDTTWSKQVKMISTTARGDKKYYAKWKRATYSITYYLKGGYFSGSHQTQYKYKNGAQLPTPTRDGYVFIGWYTNSKLTKPIDVISTDAYGDKKLYARWQKKVVIAHRGFHETLPENSYDSYIAAKEKGFTNAETDVRFTADGVPVLHHDADISISLTGGGNLAVYEKVPIASLTYEQLQTCELLKPAAGPDGTNITTFDEFMALCAEIGISPVVDIKTGTEQQIADLVSTVRKYGMIEKTSWSSFSYARL
ncbi:MAG: InlB B-repeat-containing protein, partial [Eggerthellaceae bacterium]|nr:InlB B-repeat-containing protein [Eggerthellaceae bacterium]